MSDTAVVTVVHGRSEHLARQDGRSRYPRQRQEAGR